MRLFSYSIFFFTCDIYIRVIEEPKRVSSYLKQLLFVGWTELFFFLSSFEVANVRIIIIRANLTAVTFDKSESHSMFTPMANRKKNKTKNITTYWALNDDTTYITCTFTRHRMCWRTLLHRPNHVPKWIHGIFIQTKYRRLKTCEQIYNMEVHVMYDCNIWWNVWKWFGIDPEL